jgi:hypothetical protein
MTSGSLLDLRRSAQGRNRAGANPPGEKRGKNPGHPDQGGDRRGVPKELGGFIGKLPVPPAIAIRHDESPWRSPRIAHFFGKVPRGRAYPFSGRGKAGPCAVRSSSPVLCTPMPGRGRLGKARKAGARCVCGLVTRRGLRVAIRSVVAIDRHPDFLLALTARR